jgi:parallel beta-helix repeat protein
VLGNTITRNQVDGVYLKDAANNTITGNTISLNNVSMTLDGPAATQNTIAPNQISDNVHDPVRSINGASAGAAATAKSSEKIHAQSVSEKVSIAGTRYHFLWQNKRFLIAASHPRPHPVGKPRPHAKHGRT